MNARDIVMDSGFVQIEELAIAARYSLRVRPERQGVVAEALGLDLPEKIGDRTEKDGREALCLGPNEWVILAPFGERDAIMDAASSIYPQTMHSLCEISNREITLRLSGPKVLDLLATNCPRNIAIIAPGRGVRTVFDSATVVLWRDAEDVFRLDVWRSFLPHVSALLTLAQNELQVGL